MEQYKTGLISVIIPIYNGERFIPKTIRSLQNQTYENFEVWLVEDHSKDKSKDLLKKICYVDNRFKILEPEEKMGTAVKGQEFALPYCTGEYHFFLSQDDFIDEDLFEKCIMKFKRNNADVVIPNCILYDGVLNKKLGEYPKNNNYNVPLNNREAFVLSLNWKIHGFTMEKMSLFKKVGLKAEFYNSEEYYKRILFLEASNIYFVDSNFYYRQDNPDAITKGRKYIHVDVLATDFLLYKRLYQENFDKNTCKMQLRHIVSEYKKWWLRGIRYNLLFTNNMYFLKMMLKLFIPILQERMRLLMK